MAWRGLGLRGRLFALTLAGMIPVIAVVAWDVLRHHDESRHEVELALTAYVNQWVIHHAETIDATRALLTTLAQIPHVRPGTGPACSATLAAVRGDGSTYANLAMIQPDGNILCSAVSPSGPVNVRGRPAFERAVATGAFVPGAFFIGKIIRTGALGFALPVYNAAGALESVAYAAVNLDHAREFGAAQVLQDDTLFVLVGRDGTVLARAPDPAQWVGVVIDQTPLFKRLSALRAPGSFIAPGADGIVRLFAAAPVGDAAHGAYVAVGIPLRTLEERAWNTLGATVAIACLALTVLGLISWFGIERAVVRPVRTLIDATRRIGRGELGTRTALSTGARELTDLSASFDAMAEQLETNHRRLQLSQAFAQTGAWEWNIQTGGMHWEPAVFTLLGVDPGVTSPTYAALLDRVHPDDLEHVVVQINAALDTRSALDCEFRTRRGDHGTQWLRLRADVVHDTRQRPARMLGMLHDVTARKQAELERVQAGQALRESNERFRQLAEHIREVFWMSSPDKDTVEYVSPAYELVWGRPCAELYANPRGWIEAIHPDDRDAILAASTTRQTAGNYDVSYRILRPDGETRWIRDRAFPVRDVTGRVQRIVGIAEDVTTHVEAQAERDQLQRQLQQAQKMESVGQLTGGIAHDFNNILASIMGFTSLAQRLEVARDNAKLAGYLAQVMRAGERARDLIQQLLTFSRNTDTQAKVIALHAVVGDALGMIQASLPSSMRVQTEHHDGELYTRASEVQFHQLMLNLAINARDAMHGEGTLTIATRRTTFAGGECASCHQNVTGEFCELRVSDTGGGISPAVLPRIFDPFFTTKAIGAGTGMGLPMVHGIVHRWDGHILVDTVPGVGATFRVLLPVATRDDAAALPGAPPGSSTEPATLHGLRALVVDDEPALVQFLGDLLQLWECRVTGMSDSRAALEAFRAAPEAWDVLVTDQTMPELTGLALARAVWAIRPDFPVILCSGFTDAVDEAGAVTAGFRALLTKPCDVARLRAVLDAVARQEIGTAVR